MNKQTGRFATIMTIVFTLTFTSIVNGHNYGNMAYAKHLTDQERYNSGWDQGNADCSKGKWVTNNYQHTDAYHSHSDLYHQGYRQAVANCKNTVDYNSYNGTPAISHDTPSPSNTISDQYSTIVFVVLFLLIVGIIAFKLHNRGKPKERKDFPQYVKENVIRKQYNKCAHCKKFLNVRDFDHKNGNRSDNRESNCQALCPNCHAIKTRRG